MIKTDSNSKSSSRESFQDDQANMDRKRTRKRIYKDKYGSQFEKHDSFLSKSDDGSKKGGGGYGDVYQTPKNGNKKRSAFVVASDSNNGYLSDENSLHLTPRPKSGKKMKEDEEEVKSSLYAKPLHSRVKLKVKKIDDEGVISFLFSQPTL
jgi:hypothetical protein